MRKALFLFLLISTSGLVFAQDNFLSWPSASIEAKPWTRWWWLGSAVNKPDLTFNLEQISGAGFGGVEITPIYGVKGNDKNDIPFLSPQWMEMLSHTINEGKRLSVMIDMNTGTGWPFGGPQITPEYAAGKVFLQQYQLKGGEKLPEPVVIKDAKQKGIAPLSCLMAYSSSGTKLNITDKVQPDGLLNWTAPDGSWKLIALFSGKTRQTVKRAAPGGEGLVMDHFSRQALDIYLGRFTKAFNETNSPKPHTFFNDSYEVYNADWTPSFLDEFFKRRGYRLEDYLPEFLGEGDQDIVARVKSDYRETMSDILIDNFSKPWTEWAHTMGAITRNQAHGSPANLIDVYATTDIPECETFGSTPFDIPGLRRDPEDVRNGDADPMMLKFSSSAAHIAGKKYVSSETFTWLGEHFKVALSQCKPELDQLLLSGINHVFFHGTPYSPKDAAWPGWLFYASCEFNFNYTLWKDMPGLNSYITRAQSFLQSGKPDNEVLVYWPVYDLWYDAKGMDMPLKIHDLQKWLQPSEFYKVTTWLRNNGYDMDYVSDNILKGAVTDGSGINLSGTSYKILVVPPCKFMPVETLKKIASLAEKGIKVVFAGHLPDDVPGLSDLKTNRKAADNLKSDLNKASFVGNLTPDIFAKAGIKPESAFGKGIGYVRRTDNDGNVYFFANQKSKSFDGWMKLAVDAESAALFDPLTGNSGIAAVRKVNGETEVYLQLQPDQSVILKTWASKKISGKEWLYTQITGKSMELKGPWTLTMANGYPSVPGTFKLDTLTSWTNLNNADLKSFAGTGKYTLNFRLPSAKADDWQLDLGRVAESARVKINGKDCGIWWSLPFRANVGQYLKNGQNTLEIEVTNLPANRIADLDRKGVDWKIFKEINFVNLDYKPFNASGWKIMDSGLLGPVTLTAVKKLTFK